MAFQVIKKCPHCGTIINIQGESTLRSYGCPLRTCVRCRKHYWDEDIKEPALHGFKNDYEMKQSIKRDAAMALYAPVGLIGLVGGVFSLIYQQWLSGIGLLLMAAGIVWAFVETIKKSRYEKKHSEEILHEQQEMYDLSKSRLQDTEYLTALALHDDLAEKLLQQRKSGSEEQYAARP